VKKYLIKIWKCISSELHGQLTWESNDINQLIQDVSKKIPKGCRATIEETK